MSLTVMLYTKPECVQCEQTKKLMDKEGIPFESKDVTVDDAAREHALSLGYLGAPVVQWESGGVVGGHWYGFRPDKVRELKTYLTPASNERLVGSNT